MKRILESCAILLLGLAATQTGASAQETSGLEGVWISNVTSVDCQSGVPVSPGPFVRILYQFSHDGSLTNEPGFLPPPPPEPATRFSSGLGTWRHAQAQTYNAKLRFWVFNPNNSIALMAVVTKTIELGGDVFTAKSIVQDFNVSGTLVSQMCVTEIATRAQ
jgi:hypothetical protein